jgi:hypothetical protein
MAMLQSEDFMNATIAQATKSPPPTFSKLWSGEVWFYMKYYVNKCLHC